jgi:hypothetical protein
MFLLVLNIFYYVHLERTLDPCVFTQRTKLGVRLHKKATAVAGCSCCYSVQQTALINYNL